MIENDIQEADGAGIRVLSLGLLNQACSRPPVEIFSKLGSCAKIN